MQRIFARVQMPRDPKEPDGGNNVSRINSIVLVRPHLIHMHCRENTWQSVEKVCVGVLTAPDNAAVG